MQKHAGLATAFVFMPLWPGQSLRNHVSYFAERVSPLLLVAVVTSFALVLVYCGLGYVLVLVCCGLDYVLVLVYCGLVYVLARTIYTHDLYSVL